MKLEIFPIEADKKKPKPDWNQLGFGKHFSDHFFIMKYDQSQGWHHPKIEAYRPLTLDPAAIVLHYAQEIFEGLKAYKCQNGAIHLFRAKENLMRMNRSAKRLCMPEIDIDFVHSALKELILIDQEWIPTTSGSSLYIRPTMIGTEPTIGVKASSEFIFYIIVGPAGSYYAEGFSPIRIFVSDQYVRAVRGGVGEAKTGANYAASLLAGQEAKKAGYSQVLWLDAIEQKYVEEVGTTNIFFQFENELVTSPLTGTILPGITRDSVAKLAQNWGMKYVERRISMEEVTEGANSGQLKEVFGSGTAAVISPVSELHYKGKTYKIGNGKTGPVAQKFYDELVGIQYGKKPDPFGWIERIN